MPNLTPEEYAQMIEQAKPHLIKIENAAEALGYGEMTVTLFVRAGVVTKMEFHSKETWLKDKSI